MTSVLSPAMTGFVVGVGLLTAIGPQNIALIRFSINTRFGSTFAGVCFLSHVGLLMAAISWPVAFLAPSLLRTASLAGAVLLALLGLRAAREAIVPDTGIDPTTPPPSASGRWGVASAAVVLSLANPHVYLDVVLLLGGLAAGLGETSRYAFAAGNVAAAASWFFGVAIVAGRMRHQLGRPFARRALSGVAALSLWAAAASFLS